MQIMPSNQVGPQEAATAGAGLAILLQTKLGWRRALTIVAAGEVAAYFLTPVAGWFFHTADQSLLGACGLAFGLGGVYLAGAFLNVMEQFQDAPFGLLRRITQALWGGDNK